MEKARDGSCDQGAEGLKILITRMVSLSSIHGIFLGNPTLE